MGMILTQEDWGSQPPTKQYAPEWLVAASGYDQGRFLFGGAYRLTTGASIPLIGGGFLPTTEVTIILAGRTLTTSEGGEFGNLGNQGLAYRLGGHVPYTDGVVYFDFGGVTNGTNRVEAWPLIFSESDVFVFSSGPRGMEIWQNGILVASNGASPTRPTGSSYDWGLGGNNTSSYIGGDSHWYLLALNVKQLPASQIAQYKNPTDIWQIFEPEEQVLYFASGGVTEALAGTAADTATATGAITQVVPTAGAAVVVATATGAMSLSLPLAGDASAIANATGGLSLSIPLSGNAVAQALAQAGITQAVPLGGDAAAQAAAAADISLQITLAGDSIAQAAASAGLTVTNASSLAGDAAAQAAASGGLSLDVPLAGAALTVANADGSLTQIVPLTGSAASASLATGGLDLSISLSGVALAQALASADLTAESGGVALGGDAIALAAATGTMTLHINLSGDVIAHATASGALAGAGLLTITPVYLIREAAREWRIAS